MNSQEKLLEISVSNPGQFQSSHLDTDGPLGQTMNNLRNPQSTYSKVILAEAFP